MESGSDRKRPPSAGTRGLLEAGIERTRRMTPLERMTLSLELGRTGRELQRKVQRALSTATETSSRG